MTSANGCLMSFSRRATISQTFSSLRVLLINIFCSMCPILLKTVPVLSKAIILAFFIFSKMLVFLMRIPLLMARFRMFAITLGIARPRAQGQEATKTPMPL